MRPWSFVLVVGLGIVTGCAAKTEAPQCDGAYHFHTSFPEEFKADIRQGVANWNAFAAQKVTIEGTSDEVACSFRSIEWGGDEYQAIKADVDGKDFMGFSYGRDGSIIVTEGDYTRMCVGNLGSACLVATTEHELGHAHGMVHVNAEAVMNPDTARVAFAPSDLAECQRVGACD